MRRAAFPLRPSAAEDQRGGLRVAALRALRHRQQDRVRLARGQRVERQRRAVARSPGGACNEASTAARAKMPSRMNACRRPWRGRSSCRKDWQVGRLYMPCHVRTDQRCMSSSSSRRLEDSEVERDSGETVAGAGGRRTGLRLLEDAELELELEL